MGTRYTASTFVLCSLALLLLAAACAPTPSPNVPPAGVAAAPSPAPTGSGAVPTAAAAAAGRLVFASDRGGNGELYVVDVPPAGSAPAGPLPARQLTSDGKWSGNPAVSPDGQWIVYQLHEPGGDPGTTPPIDLWLLSLDGQKRFNLTQSPAPELGQVWSPDGSQIAFASKRDGGQWSIWIQDVAPILAGQAPAPRKIVDNADTPVWSPDGRQIAYLAATDGPGSTQLFTVNPDGTGKRQLTAHSVAGDTRGISVPAWSPDSRWMMVPMYFGPALRLVLLPVDGTTAPIPDKDLRIVTPDEKIADEPAWEADSRWVAFRCGDRITVLCVMDMQSGEVHRITPQLSGAQPVWSPDGSRLSFSADSDVYVINPDGSNLLKLTDNPANDWGPAAWVPPNQRPE